MLCPQNLHVEALNPNVSVFGDRASEGVIKVQGGPKGGPVSH